ncbi:MAG: helix-turn-helix domain-containing protein [Planctomycetota bacterium]
MAKKPSKSQALQRAMDRAAAPVYLVRQRVIAYANPALAEWVDLPLEAVIGRPVAYHSEEWEEAASGLIAGLCPPPASFAGEAAATGEAVTAPISCLGRDGRLRHRRAEFTPLTAKAARGARERESDVLAVVATVDLSPQELSKELSADAPAAWLHATLTQFRRSERERDATPWLLGDSAAAQRLRRQVKAVIASAANAVFCGGDALANAELARYSHRESDPEQPSRLLVIDAALVEAEQLLEQAAEATSTESSSTLLMLNANALAIEAQNALASALEPQPNRRLLVTTNSPLASERLMTLAGTVVVDVPMLTQRKEDLPLIAQWAVESVNASSEKQVGGLTGAAIDLLALHPWPGGVEQLRVAIATAHAQASGPMIDSGDLPHAMQQAALAAELPPSTPTRIVLDKFLARIEHELVTRALTESAGNKAEAARLLGMTRPRLYRRMANLGLIDSEGAEKESGQSDG